MANGPGPLVSVIVPSFNQASYLPDALDSILAQDYRPIEVLVLDGGSTDGTVDILADYAARWDEIRWWSEPDRGVADAVNKGLARARGTFAGIQSSDDLYLQGAITAAVEAFDAQPELGLVYGDGCFIDAAATRVDFVTRYLPYSLTALLTGATLILQSSAFFRLDVARAAGGWRENCYVADLDLWMRMVFMTPVRKVDGVWSAWRAHPDQRNERTAEIWESYWQMIEESEGIRRSSLRVRLAARAGRRAFTAHYNPTGSSWFLRLQLWRAVLTYPPVFRPIPTAKKKLMIPGWMRIEQLLAERGAARPAPPQPTAGIELRWWSDLRDAEPGG